MSSETQRPRQTPAHAYGCSDGSRFGRGVAGKDAGSRDGRVTDLAGDLVLEPGGLLPQRLHGRARGQRSGREGAHRGLAGGDEEDLRGVRRSPSPPPLFFPSPGLLRPSDSPALPRWLASRTALSVDEASQVAAMEPRGCVPTPLPSRVGGRPRRLGYPKFQTAMADRTGPRGGLSVLRRLG